MFKCKLCEYATDRLYNLTRHESSHAKRDTKKDESQEMLMFSQCDKCHKMFEGLSNLRKHVHYCSKKEQRDEKSHHTILANEERVPCPTCYKTFTTDKGLLRHVCKMISDPNSCPNCKRVLSNGCTKTRHMKKCGALLLQQDQSEPPVSVTNNIQTQINNNCTNNNSNNTVNNNIQIMLFDKTNAMEFLVDHMNRGQLKAIFDRPGDNSQGIIEYAKKVMERPENRLVKKTNLRCNYSKIHTGADTWEVTGDEDVYPKVMQDISAQAWDLLREKNEERDFNFQRQSFRTLLDTLEQLSDGGYCNTDDEESREARLLFKNSVHMLKYVMFNLTQPSKS